MTTIKTPDYLEVDGEHAAVALEGVREKLEAGTEVTLQFSRVRRIEPAVVRALELLALSAEEKAARITLRGVTVEVYKVMKLTRLTSRFTFMD